MPTSKSTPNAPTKKTNYLTNIEQVLPLIINHTKGDIRLGAQLGLGKPYELINAIYDTVANNPDYKMTIYTALSLNPPQPKSELEQRFLTPFLNRIYGKDFPRLKYVDALTSNTLPTNIAIEEFYMQSGAMLGSISAQSHYTSLNYTHVPQALAKRKLNVMVQKIAQNDKGEYSLAGNTDLTQDTMDALIVYGEALPLTIGVVDPDLPFVGTEAIVPASLFDIIMPAQDAQTRKDSHLFALPRQPVDDVDYAIGLYASTLVKDGGTLQIGIGALADALCHALVLRHRDNATYRQVLKALDPNIEQHPTVQEYGGLEPFEVGLYGCSEMINEGFRLLVEAGIVKRRVVDDLDIMRRVADGTATDKDNATLAAQGQFLHGAFYLGSPEFYDWLRALAPTNNTLGMRRISEVNSVVGRHYELECHKRQQPRFFNTCMMATALGGAASETLPDGRVVSGVGGQYNFVSMSYDLPHAKSILMLRATRNSNGDTTSNVLWNVANMTIPRHLRDIYITEYGIADLRYATDGDCIKTMLNVTDATFQEDLLQQAYSNKKLIEATNNDVLKPDNTRENLCQRLKPYRKNGTLPDYPLGSDFTPVEQDIVRALSWLKANTQTRSEQINAVFDMFAQTVSEKFDDVTDLFVGRATQDTTSQLINEAMVRMGYRDESGNEIDKGINSELLEHALKETLNKD